MSLINAEYLVFKFIKFSFLKSLDDTKLRISYLSAFKLFDENLISLKISALGEIING